MYRIEKIIAYSENDFLDRKQYKNYKVLSILLNNSTGKDVFDEFLEKETKGVNILFEEKILTTLGRSLEIPPDSLPPTLFKWLKGLNVEVCEVKAKNKTDALRLYCWKSKVYGRVIILLGHKNDQDKDIKKVVKRIKGL